MFYQVVNGTENVDMWLDRGVALMVLAFIGWFWVKYVWPFVTAQIEKMQLVNQAMNEKFIAIAENQTKTNEQIAELLKQFTVSLHAINLSMTEIKTLIRGIGEETNL